MQAFYKGDPDKWFTLPRRKLNVYIAALPRIEAQQRLQDVGAISAGTSGQMKPADRRKYIGRLERTAHGKKKVLKATREDLAMLGIPVREV